MKTTTILAIALIGCSREVVVEQAGSGGAGGSSTATSSRTTSSSSTTAASTSTGVLSCILDGACAPGHSPTPGVACKTNVALAEPDGTCDAAGNCCTVLP